MVGVVAASDVRRNSRSEYAVLVKTTQESKMAQPEGAAGELARAAYKASAAQCGTFALDRGAGVIDGPQRGCAGQAAFSVLWPASTSNSIRAAEVEEAGFCPVTRRPSTTECGCQLRTFSKMAPRRINSSSTRNGTTWVSWASASSPLVKPVTCLSFTSGSPL